MQYTNRMLHCLPLFNVQPLTINIAQLAVSHSGNNIQAQALTQSYIYLTLQPPFYPMLPRNAHNLYNVLLLHFVLILIPFALAQNYCDPALCPAGLRHVVCGNSGVSETRI